MRRRYINVVYEDRDLIVVNKPRGIIVAGEKGEECVQRTAPLIDDVRAYIRHKFEGAKSSFARPLHRLDKETTGLVLFAKSKNGMKLIAPIKEHKVKRYYLAVVEGRIEDESGTIDHPLVRGDFGFGKKVGIAKKGEGKKAVTHYRVIERYENATLVEARLETGFTHQIRVHFASIGHPLVGDKVYNPYGKIKFPRQALHACSVVFYHPCSGKKVMLKADPPRDMEGLIDRLRG